MSIGAPASESGWSGLFWEAFRRSRNTMVLLDGQRRVVEVNGSCLGLLGYRRNAMVGHQAWEFVDDGPLMSAREWRAVLRRRHFTGEVHLITADDRRVRVEFAGHPEIVTGRHLVLAVATTTGRRRPRDTEQPQPDQASEPLSKREREVVELISLGLSGPEIAQELHLSHNTVRTHARNSMRKLDARSRAHLVAKAMGETLYVAAAS